MATDTWNGANASWTTADDWSLGTVPDAGDAVEIPALAYGPEVFTDVGAIESLDIAAGRAIVSVDGGDLTVDGAVTNAGGLAIGDDYASAPSVMTAASLSGAGSIDVIGSSNGDYAASLKVGSSADLIGASGSIVSGAGVYVAYDASLVFASGQITTIAGGLFIGGAHAYVADASDPTSNSALAGLETISGSLSLEGGASIAVDDNLTIQQSGVVDVDYGYSQIGSGGSTLDIAGSLTNDGTVDIGIVIPKIGEVGGSVSAGGFVNSGTLDMVDSALDVAGTAPGTIEGSISLDDSTIQFGSGVITTVLDDSQLSLLESVVNDAGGADDSALAGLSDIAGLLSLQGSGAVTTTGNLAVTGEFYIDSDNYTESRGVSVGGSLTNSGVIALGNASVADEEILSAASLTNYAGVTMGTLYITGGKTVASTLDIAGAAGFGAAGVLKGSVDLYDHAVVEFGSGEIDRIAVGSELTLDDVLGDAYVADASALGSNSALTGLASIAGTLNLDHGASVAVADALGVSGSVNLDNSAALTVTGAMTVKGTVEISGGATLTVGSAEGAGAVEFLGRGSIVVTGAAGSFDADITEFGADDTIEFAAAAYSSNEHVSVVSVEGDDATFAVENGANDVVATFTAPDYLSDSDFTLSDDDGHLLVGPGVSLAFRDSGDLPDSTTQTLLGTIEASDAGRTISIYDGATRIGTTTANSMGVWSVTVTLSGASPHVLTARITAASGGTAVSSAQTLAVGGGETVELDGGEGSAASLYGTSGDADNIYGSYSTVYLHSAQAAVVGSADTISFAGADDSVSLSGSPGPWNVVDGSNGSVSLTSAQATVVGGGDAIGFAGSGDAVSLFASSGLWDQVNGSGGTVYLNGAQTAVVGGGDTIDFVTSDDNAVSLYGTSGDWDQVNGNHGVVYLQSAQAVVSGASETVDFAGTGNALTLADSVDIWDTVNGSEGTIYLESAQAGISGSDDSVYFHSGTGNAVTFAGGDDAVFGSDGAVFLQSAEASVNGGGDTVSFVSGVGNAATLLNTSQNWDLVYGSSGAVYLTRAQAAIVGGGNTIDFVKGANNVASLYQTSGVPDSVTASKGALYLEGAQASVAGDDDTITLLDGSITQNGATDTFVFQPKFYQDVIDGFASSDTMQFSQSDFANFAALEKDTKQVGSNTVITLDVADTVTLSGVTASSLVSSQFKFV